MNKIPTAEEFFNNLYPDAHVEHCNVNNAMIEFAKFHAEAQVKAIIENVKIDEHEIERDELSNQVYCEVNENSILNAYPLSNIK